MKIELVVLDMAGTTVEDNDAVLECFQAAMAGAGLTAEPAAVKAVMGLPKPEAIRRLLESHFGPQAALQAIHEDFVERMKRYYKTDPGVREVAGASRTFEALRRAGIKVALNTGFSRDIVQILLERLGWTGTNPLIDATVSSDEVPRGRPHPEMILHLMRQLGIKDASRVAKIGDTEVDLEEGTNAGCSLVIGVTTGSCTRAQLESKPHTHILNSVADLPALLL